MATLATEKGESVFKQLQATLDQAQQNNVATVMETWTQKVHNRDVGILRHALKFF